MTQHQVVLLANDPALERVLRGLFPDGPGTVRRASSLEEVGGVAAAGSVAVLVGDAWLRTSRQALGPEQREQLLGRGRAAAVVLVSGDSWAGKPAGAGAASAIIVDEPYQLDRLPILLLAAAGHDPNADSAPAS